MSMENKGMEHETVERKTVKFEVKDVDEKEGTFSGYAATFAKHPDSYGDIIDHGAFKKTLKEMGSRVKILWNHYVLEPIGLPTKLEEDEKGLYVEGKLSLGVQRAREVLSLMKDGVITEMSIGYNTLKETYEEGIRHLQEVRLWDVSPVTFAANPEAVILGVKEMELKPYPNEHACRLRDPDDFKKGSFRRTTRVSDGKKYSVIMGRLKEETTLTEQAYRYNKEIWEEVQAKTHCKDHDGAFEAAEKDKTYKCECIECGHKLKSKKHCSEIKCPECGGEMRREERPGPGKSDEEREEEEKSGRVLSASSLEKVRAALKALQALLDAAESEPEPAKSTQLSEEAIKEAARLEATIAGLKAENEGFDIREAEGRIEAILERIKK